MSVEHNDDTLAAAKTRERDQCAERHTDQRRKDNRAQAYDKRQPHNGDERRIGGEHKLKS